MRFGDAVGFEPQGWHTMVAEIGMPIQIQFDPIESVDLFNASRDADGPC